MDQQDPCGSPAGCLFNMIGPPPKIGKRLPFKYFRVVYPGVIDPGDNNFIGYIHILVIIPFPKIRLNSKTDENCFSPEVNDFFFNGKGSYNILHVIQCNSPCIKAETAV